VDALKETFILGLSAVFLSLKLDFLCCSCRGVLVDEGGPFPSSFLGEVSCAKRFGIVDARKNPRALSFDGIECGAFLVNDEENDPAVTCIFCE
jgi:hypothetical protein